MVATRPDTVEIAICDLKSDQDAQEFNAPAFDQPRALHSARRRSARAIGRYRCPVSGQRVPGGVVHKLPVDLRDALIANTSALGAWKDITPLARNEFICWVEDAKQTTTRERRI